MVRRRSTGVNALPAGEVREQRVDTLFTQWLAARATQSLVDDVLRPTGLSSDELPVYSMLASCTPVTPTELARWMAAPPTTVSSLVKRLESRGHVMRSTHPEDRRSYRIELTAEGTRAHTAAIERFRPVSTRVERLLGDRRAEVDDALLTLRAAVEEVRGSVT